ncbi:MAG: ribosome biogenesis GTPase Der [Acidobacteria bacterium]|nr:ribosome biogenesis GTPase Der [Acidobacteriota bacterium]
MPVRTPHPAPRRRRLRSVVLVGRPNVGKSTLFNRLTGARRAIVTSVPGTTRDVIAQPAEWRGRRFELVDTGGMFGASADPLHALVLERGRRAIGAADLLVLVVDGREGLVPGDREIAKVAREADTPVIVAVNKCDDRRAQSGLLEFPQLGFDPVIEVSGEHGQGSGDLLDAIVDTLGLQPARADAEEDDKDDREDDEEHGRAATGEVGVAIVGRPNAGKSSLVNRLLREERMIVSEMPGTTRDVVDTSLTWHRRQFRIIDTAGMRRPGRVASSGQVESVSVLLSRRAMQGADVAVIMIDATEGASDQDAAIAGEAEAAGCGIIVAVNKWDLMKERGPDFATEFDETLRRQLKFLDFAPVLHISAVTGERTPRLLETIDRVAAARTLRVKTPELNAFIRTVAARHPPPSHGRTETRILYAVQTGIAPPTFVLFTNVAAEFHFSYKRFLVNQLRQAFGFAGSPIRLNVRRRRHRRRV